MSSSAPDPLPRLVAFVDALRREGLRAGTGAALDFARAAALLPAGDLYWAGRATLAQGPAAIAVYDRVFRTFFGAVAPQPPPRPRARIIVDAPPKHALLASAVEVLRRTSFASLTDDELARLPALVDRLRLVPPRRRSRRRRRARGGELDLRRTLRRSFRTGGEPAELRFRARVRRPRRLVLLLDVSRSMEPYSRALLVFAHAAMRADAHWEAFCFGTRLTRLTPALRDPDPARALALVAEAAADRGAGTRIAESFAQLLATREHVAALRGAVVVVCSDGLEGGDPEALRRQMARLARLASRVAWLNPLKEDPAYEPLAGGMRAALPFVDLFAGAHDLASLEAAAARLARL